MDKGHPAGMGKEHREGKERQASQVCCLPLNKCHLLRTLFSSAISSPLQMYQVFEGGCDYPPSL